MKIRHIAFLLLLLNFRFRPLQGFFRAIGLVRPSLLFRSLSMIITGKPSSSETLTHLQLQNVNDLSTLIPSVQPNDSSDNDTKSNSLEVHEFIKADGEILCACTSSRFTLVHLTKYLNLTKYFSNTTVFYRKAEYKYDDKEAYSHYLALFKAGRMLISSTTYKEMWTEGDEGPKKKSLDALLKNNVERYLKVVENKAMQDKITKYLSSQKLDDRYKFDKGRNREEHLNLLQDFANWFRATFPYYYGQCQQCNDRPSSCYMGTLHPTPAEVTDGQASRVELHACGKCGAYSRFPRFIDVSEVLSTCRGRCGEYSILCLVMLRQLGYESRWVVDRDDHVWVEVNLPPHWIHLDPCEASVGNPTLYEDWGKHPTFVLAFDHDLDREVASIIDITEAYVRDANGVSARRREEGMGEEDAKKKIDSAQIELMSCVQAARNLLKKQ